MPPRMLPSICALALLPLSCDINVVVVEILTTLEELGRARIRFAYEVRRVDDSTQLATGSTEHAAIGPDGRARRIPPELRELLG